MNIDNEDVKQNEADNKSADVRVSTLVCNHPDYKPGLREHKFCCEFQNAILNFANAEAANIKDIYGNWFGRLVAFGYTFEADNQSFAEYANLASHIIEDDFRQKLKEKRIWFKVYETNFSNVSYDPAAGIITAEVYIAVGGEINLNGTYTLTFKVKEAGFETTEIKIQ